MKIRKSLCFALCGVLGLSLMSCKNDSVEKTDQEKIYDLYVSYAAATGETPKSYEEWLKSIQGPKGDTGATGPQGPQGEQGATGADGVGIEDILVSYGFNEQGQSIMTLTFVMSNGERIVKNVIIPERITELYLEDDCFDIIQEGEKEPTIYAQAVYSSGHKERIEITEDMISEKIDFTKTGEYYVKISVQGYTNDYLIRIYDSSITMVQNINVVNDESEELTNALYGGLSYMEGITLEELTSQIKTIFIGKEIEVIYFDHRVSNIAIDESMLDFSNLDVSTPGKKKMYLLIEGYKQEINISISPNFNAATFRYTLEVATPEGVQMLDFYDNGMWKDGDSNYGEYTINNDTLTLYYSDSALYYTLDLTNPTQPIANVFNFDGYTQIAEYTFAMEDMNYQFTLYDNNLTLCSVMVGGELYLEMTLDYRKENDRFYVMGGEFIIHEDGSLEPVQ